jgi:hypothetical protein
MSTGFSMDVSIAFSTGRVVLSLETRGGVGSLPPSNFAASDAVLRGRTVAFVELDVFLEYSGRSGRSREGESSSRAGDSGSLEGERSSREGERKCEGELGGSPAFAVPRVFSQGGAFWEALLVVGWRRGTGDRAPDVSLGLRGELVGVEGRAVEGEPPLMEPGRRKGDWRALLKKRGVGLESEGADCSSMLVSPGSE